MYILGTEFSSTGKREPMWKTQRLLDSRMWRFLLLTRGTRHSRDTSRTWKFLWKVIWILYHIIREHLPAKKFLSCIAQITFPPFSQIWASWSFFPGRQKQKNGLKAARMSGFWKNHKKHFKKRLRVFSSVYTGLLHTQQLQWSYNVVPGFYGRHLYLVASLWTFSSMRVGDVDTVEQMRRVPAIHRKPGMVHGFMSSK